MKGSSEYYRVGVIAQELENEIPEVLKEGLSGYKAVRYEKITPLLIECIKKQQEQIEKLGNDIEELKKAVGPETKMIVTVSVLGNPCNFDEITKICDANNIILFEDNCESMGAKFNDVYTGTFGLIGTFSTFFSHHISTMEGGMIVTDDFSSCFEQASYLSCLRSARVTGGLHWLSYSQIRFNFSLSS